MPRDDATAVAPRTDACFKKFLLEGAFSFFIRKTPVNVSNEVILARFHRQIKLRKKQITLYQYLKTVNQHGSCG